MLVPTSPFSHWATFKSSPPKVPVPIFYPQLASSNVHPKFHQNFNLLSLSFIVFSPKRKTHHRSHHKTPVRSLFTGIVEEMGEIKRLGISGNGGFEMRIGAKSVMEGVNLGDSISVNGTCLTVTKYDAQSSEFTVGLSPETLRRTSLMELVPGSLVNLERALTMEKRMGGHFVQGHVDGTGEIVAVDIEGDSLWVKVRTSPEVLKYIVPKGYITVDGTSLTVVKVFDEEQCFNFMLVAYTQQHVVIPLKKAGQKVNLEVDILSKYVERLLSSGISKNVMPP